MNDSILSDSDARSRRRCSYRSRVLAGLVAGVLAPALLLAAPGFAQPAADKDKVPAQPADKAPDKPGNDGAGAPAAADPPADLPKEPEPAAAVTEPAQLPEQPAQPKEERKAEPPPQPVDGPQEPPLADEPMAPPGPKREGREWWRQNAVLELGPIRLAPVAFLSAQVAPYVGDEAFFQSGDVAERAGFRLRNARFGFDSAYEDQARLRVTAEIGGDTDGELRVHDAWFGYTPFNELGIFAGAQRAPFGRFAQIASGQGALIQRPKGTGALSPGHQIGVTAQGAVADGVFRYAAGVFNGLQRNPNFYQGYQRNYSPFGNRFDGLSVLARVATEPLGPVGNTAADEEKGDARLGVGANYLFSDGGSRDIHSAGGDAHLKVAGFHAMGEFLWAFSTPATEPTQPDAPTGEVTTLTFAGEAGYMIIERMLNVAVRFEWIDPDTLSDDESDNWLITGGAGVYLVDQLLRAQVEYSHREEMSGRSLSNDVVVLQFQVQIDPGSAPPDAGGSAPVAAKLRAPLPRVRGAM